MSRFHQRLNEDLNDPEFAEAFYDMSVDITLLQVLEQARKALNVSEKELAERMGVQGSTIIGNLNSGDKLDLDEYNEVILMLLAKPIQKEARMSTLAIPD